MAEQKMTAIQVLSNTTLTVQNQIDDYVKKGKLILPPNYSAGNALKQFQLAVQDNEKLMSCTQASLAKAMLDMVILGLNISKSQIYVIPYGNKAQLSVSYMGKIAIAKRIDPTIKDIIAKVVKDGEDFDFEDNLEDGYSVITKHKRTLQSMDSKNYIAAYATIIYNDEKPNKSLIMTFDRIKKSWMKSMVHPIDNNGNIKAGTTHDLYTEDMMKRTVINAICKMIINTSSDADLFNEVLEENELNEAKTLADAESAEKMSSKEMIDVEFEEVSDDNPHTVIDDETGEIFE